jgi:hypothetical protein
VRHVRQVRADVGMDELGRPVSSASEDHPPCSP